MSRVFFSDMRAGHKENLFDKIAKLLTLAGLDQTVAEGDLTAVKIHFGEEGNTGFINPQHVRVVCAAIINRGAKVFLSDANTLYRGKRLNSKDHLEIAYKHGFTKEVTGVDVIIPDDNKKEDKIEIPVDLKFIKVAKIARVFIAADAFVAVSHFKGHILTGFGGTIKNIGMGCATREGKLAQHCDLSPVVHVDKCIGCGECAIVCPVKAIRIENKKSVIDKTKCIGCASCLAACPTMAMFIDFAAGDKTQGKMTEYCLAVLKEKKEKSGFINFAIKINKECDCWGVDNPQIAPDLGILASLDPVSIDKASLDLVNKANGKDIFKAVHPDQDGMKQLNYAQEIGLGSLDYELIEL